MCVIIIECHYLNVYVLLLHGSSGYDIQFFKYVMFNILIINK